MNQIDIYGSSEAELLLTPGLRNQLDIVNPPNGKVPEYPALATMSDSIPNLPVSCHVGAYTIFILPSVDRMPRSHLGHQTPVLHPLRADLDI